MDIILEKVNEFNDQIKKFIESHSLSYNIEEGYKCEKDNDNDNVLYQQYHIIFENNIVGFFVLVEVNYEYGDGIELEIGVLDEYQGKGIAHECITGFQNKITNWREIAKDKKYLYALIKGSNKQKQEMYNLLSKSGFLKDIGSILDNEDEIIPVLWYKKLS